MRQRARAENLTICYCKKKNWVSLSWARSVFQWSWNSCGSTRRSIVNNRTDEKTAVNLSSSNRSNLKNAGFRFRVHGKYYENGAFRNANATDKLAIPLPKFYSDKNPTWAVILEFWNFSGVVWPENIWWGFRVKPSFSNSSTLRTKNLKTQLCVLVWTENIFKRNFSKTNLWWICSISAKENVYVK